MMRPQLVIVSGLPGVGKSRVAARLSSHYRLPLVAKDTIKETLFDTLGTGEPRWSRLLSNASFAAMFAVASQVLTAGGSVMLEGNFRPGEHENAVRELLATRARRVIQVLCRLPEEQRRQRLEQRAMREERHPGHLDSLLLRRDAERNLSADQFLNLPSSCLLHNTEGDAELAWERLRQDMDLLLANSEST